MKNQLHAAGFIEEALGDDFILPWHCAEDGDSVGDVADDLLGRRLRHGHFALKPGGRRGAIGQPLRNRAAQVRHRLRQLHRARRRLAHPEGNTRRQSLGVVNPNLA